MAILAAKCLITFLLVPVFSQQICAQKEACTQKGVAVDDVTSLLQSRVELKRGGAPRKLSVVEEKDDVKEEVKQTKWSGHDHGMWTQGLAEFIAMALYVFIGCGASMGLQDCGAKVFHVALAFGFAITALRYSLGHYSGGQINFAVTFGLMCIRSISIQQGLVNLAFQMMGAICGSLLTMAVFPAHADNTCIKETGTGGLGINVVSAGYTTTQALVAEMMGSFMVVYVVLETAVNPGTVVDRSLACVAIGMAVFLAHSMLIPIDGCSVNPTRSFGPMIVKKLFRNDGGVMKDEEDDEAKSDAYIKDHWIFWAGPIGGAFVASLTYRFMHQE